MHQICIAAIDEALGEYQIQAFIQGIRLAGNKMGSIGPGEHHQRRNPADGLIGCEHVYIAGKNQIDLIEIMLVKIRDGGMIALPGFHVYICP